MKTKSLMLLAVLLLGIYACNNSDDPNPDQGSLSLSFVNHAQNNSRIAEVVNFYNFWEHLDPTLKDRPLVMHYSLEKVTSCDSETFIEKKWYSKSVKVYNGKIIASEIQKLDAGEWRLTNLLITVELEDGEENTIAGAISISGKFYKPIFAKPTIEDEVANLLFLDVAPTCISIQARTINEQRILVYWVGEINYSFDFGMSGYEVGLQKMLDIQISTQYYDCGSEGWNSVLPVQTGFSVYGVLDNYGTITADPLPFVYLNADGSLYTEGTSTENTYLRIKYADNIIGIQVQYEMEGKTSIQSNAIYINELDSYTEVFLNSPEDCTSGSSDCLICNEEGLIAAADASLGDGVHANVVGWVDNSGLGLSNKLVVEINNNTSNENIIALCSGTGTSETDGIVAKAMDPYTKITICIDLTPELLSEGLYLRHETKTTLGGGLLGGIIGSLLDFLDDVLTSLLGDLVNIIECLTPGFDLNSTEGQDLKKDAC
ncbi:hypothetical protein V6R21_18095 [Limibacter armeniacum]|uniref:hypothetical protein n=1 Tax=Limibacter armeniacum TaxID=466084 RepID=UPI002FE63D50